MEFFLPLRIDKEGGLHRVDEEDKLPDANKEDETLAMLKLAVHVHTLVLYWLSVIDNSLSIGSEMSNL